MVGRPKAIMRQAIVGSGQSSSSNSAFDAKRKLNRLFADRDTTVATIAEIVRTHGSPLKFNRVNDDAKKAALRIREEFNSGDLDNVHTALSSSAVVARVPIENLSLILMSLEVEGSLSLASRRYLRKICHSAGLVPIADTTTRYGIDLLPFGSSVVLEEAGLYTLSDPTYLKRRYGSGGITIGSSVYLPSEAQGPARHEMQHVIDWLVRIVDRRSGNPNLRRDMEYRAKLAEIYHSEDPGHTVLNFRLSASIKSNIDLIVDSASQVAHNAAEKRVVREFDGVPKASMREKAIQLLDQSYLTWAGVSLTEIFDYCVNL